MLEELPHSYTRDHLTIRADYEKLEINRVADVVKLFFEDGGEQLPPLESQNEDVITLDNVFSAADACGYQGFLNGCTLNDVPILFRSRPALKNSWRDGWQNAHNDWDAECYDTDLPW